MLIGKTILSFTLFKPGYKTKIITVIKMRKRKMSKSRIKFDFRK
jgi:hypothetical protein